MEDAVELLIEESAIIRDNGEANRRENLALLVIDLRDGTIESALEAFFHPIDNASLLLQRGDTLQGQIRG